MSLSDFWARLKSKSSIIEGSHDNIPVMGNNQSLAEVYDRFLDENNCRQTSILSRDERPFLCLLDAHNFAEDEYDIEGFMARLVYDAFITSASIDGHRSLQLQNIAVGQMSRDFQLELQEIRAGGKRRQRRRICTGSHPYQAARG